MKNPHLFTNQESIEKIKINIEKYAWYKKAFMRIQQDCDKMIEQGFEVPSKKGYVFNETCPAHNKHLIFNPYKQYSFMCPVCKVDYKDEPYKRAWINIYHSWLSQMSMYLGICYLITEKDKYSKAIKQILDAYTKHYPSYPNNDNEIGTAKLSQSTFIESIWLTHLCGAYDMVAKSNVFKEQDHSLYRNLILNSAEIIKDYDEKWNNRQAFNNTALLAAGFLTQTDELVQYALYGEHGFVKLMGHSILEDGLWYEGDNYHFATMPSILNMAVMCKNNGIDMFNKQFKGRSIKDMLNAPLASLQPDGTFPSRKDSAYASSIFQRWYCGFYELAYDIYNEEDFGALLNWIYSSPVQSKKPLASAAGIIDVTGAFPASRENLDWRAFLNINPMLPSLGDKKSSKSINMTGTGLGILRRQNDYVSLDYGYYGGGHGHPDRLNLSCFLNGRRWLTDYGTCNYYLDQLKYYRSSIGHNTITQDGKNHYQVSGHSILFHEGEMFDAVSAVVEGIYPDTTAQRTLVLLDNILLDFIKIKSLKEHTYHNAYHSYGTLNTGSYEEVSKEQMLQGEAYEYLMGLKKNNMQNQNAAIFELSEASLHLHTANKEQMIQYCALSYGPPDQITEYFPVVIQEKRGDNIFFANAFENVEKDEDAKIVSFKYINDYSYELSLVNQHVYYIDLTNGVHIKRKIQSSGNDIEDKIENVDYSFEKEQCMKIKHNDEQSKVVKKRVDIENYVKVKNYSYDRLDTNLNINEALQNNIFIQSIDNIARAERHWQGLDDLSAVGSLFVNNGHSLALILKINDDKVLFSGGKYPYDNDSIQLYIDRSTEDSEEIYSMLLSGGDKGHVSKVHAITGNIKKLQEISLTMNVTEYGYDMCLNIPFYCIGGTPNSNDVWGFDIVINDRDSGVRRDQMAIWSGALQEERIYMKAYEHASNRFGLISFV